MNVFLRFELVKSVNLVSMSFLFEDAERVY